MTAKERYYRIKEQTKGIQKKKEVAEMLVAAKKASYTINPIVTVTKQKRDSFVYIKWRKDRT